MLALVFCLLLQEDESLEKAKTAIDACIARQGKITLGGVQEVLQVANNSTTFFSSQKKFKEAAEVCAHVSDALVKSLGGLESKSPEIRKVILQLERGTKRAGARDNPEKKCSAYRYAFERARLHFQVEEASIRALVGIGLDCLQAGEFDEAEEALKEAEERIPAVLGSDPKTLQPEARLGAIVLGQNYFAMGKYADAGASIRRGVLLAPEWLDKQDFDLKMFHKQNGDYASMLKKLEEYVESKPTDLDARFFLGYAYFFSEKRERAKPIFESILEKNKSDKSAQYFMDRLKE